MVLILLLSRCMSWQARAMVRALRREGGVSIPTALLLTTVGVLGVSMLPQLSRGFERSIAERSTAAPSATQQVLPSVGMRSEAALSAARLFSMLDQLPDVARASVDAYRFKDALATAFKRQDGAGVGRALVPEALRNVGGEAAVTHSPAPNEYESAMRLLARSEAKGAAPLVGLRKVYDRALNETLPHVLATMRTQYSQAFAELNADARRWEALQKRAEDLVVEMRARTTLSSDHVFALVEAFESAKYGFEVEVPRSFTPVFSESLVRSRSVDLVDSFTAARELYTEGQKILFPHEVLPPTGAEYPPSPYNLLVTPGAKPASLKPAADRTYNVRDFISNGSRRGLLMPERLRRRALLRETFPGSALYETRPEDARKIIASTYLNTVTTRQQNKFNEWFVKVRQHVKTNLTDEQRAMVRKITSLPRILFGTNKP